MAATPISDALTAAHDLLSQISNGVGFGPGTTVDEALDKLETAMVAYQPTDEPTTPVVKPHWLVTIEFGQFGGDSTQEVVDHVEKLMEDAGLSHLVTPYGITVSPANDAAQTTFENERLEAP